MTIERAAATADDTLDQTSDTLIAGLTLTPAADDYLLYATVEALTADPAGSETTTFSVYVGGTRIDHTQRQIEEETSIDQANLMVALNCKVSPNGSQAVEIRARTSGTASPLTAQRREMTLLPIPTGTDYQETAETDDTKSGSTWVTLGSMTRTPVSGTYLLVFSTTLSGPENMPNGANLRVSVGGSPLAHTVRAMGANSSAVNVDTPIALACEVNPNGSQVVEIEWSNQGTGTVTAHQRTMNIIPTASGDIFEATGTVDDVDSTTTDKQIDDMLITDPGADDYLVIFTSYDYYGTIGNNVAETIYSIRVGGTKVTDSDRMNEHEGSNDTIDLPVTAGGRVTVAGGTDDLQMYWQNGTTDERTIHERTMVAIREPSAATFNRYGDDASTIDDDGLLEHIFYRNADESSIAISDTLLIELITALIRLLSDTITATDTPRYETFLHKLLSEIQTVSDDPRYTAFLHRFADDSSTLTDEIFTELLKIFEQYADDSTTVQDDIRYEAFLHRYGDDSTTVQDIIRYLTFLHRYTDDSTNVQDKIQNIAVLFRLLAETQGLTDDIFMSLVFETFLDDSITLTDAIRIWRIVMTGLLLKLQRPFS